MYSHFGRAVHSLFSEAVVCALAERKTWHVPATRSLALAGACSRSPCTHPPRSTHPAPPHPAPPRPAPPHPTPPHPTPISPSSHCIPIALASPRARLSAHHTPPHPIPSHPTRIPTNAIIPPYFILPNVIASHPTSHPYGRDHTLFDCVAKVVASRGTRSSPPHPAQPIEDPRVERMQQRWQVQVARANVTVDGRSPFAPL